MWSKIFALWAAIACVATGARRRRYVSFPEGSTFIATLCLTSNTLAQPRSIFLEGTNWGLSYDLPNATTFIDALGKNKYALKRRQRRDLYVRFETIVERLGYEGKPCIYRAMCEAGRRRGARTLGTDLLRILLAYPLKKLSADEPDDHRLYHWAARRGVENPDVECSRLFPGCSLSLLDMALGGS